MVAALVAAGFVGTNLVTWGQEIPTPAIPGVNVVPRHPSADGRKSTTLSTLHPRAVHPNENIQKDSIVWRRADRLV